MKAFARPVSTYGCEVWTLKKEEERRIQAFENKCMRKLLRIPWTKMMSNYSRSIDLHVYASQKNSL